MNQDQEWQEEFRASVEAQEHKEEQEQRPGGDEVLGSFLELVERSRKEGLEEPVRLEQILDICVQFLRERPEPPKAWLERFALDGRQFDYHQIAIPEDQIDPELDDIGNLLDLKERFCTAPASEGRVVTYQALEHYLLTRNHFLFGNGHFEPIPAPRPVLMLESHPEDDEVDWDCYATFFADGSYSCFNLEAENEESIGRDAGYMVEISRKVLAQLALHVPVEGEDFGVVGFGACE